MEDNGRGLDPNPVNTTPAKYVSLSSKQITVMLIGSVGKIRSFKISRKLILYASIFFLIYIIVSLLIFYLYFDLAATYSAQSKKLEAQETELRDKTKSLEQNRLYVKGLEDYINTLRGETKDTDDTGKTRDKPIQEDRPPAGAPRVMEQTTTEQTKEAGKMHVDVRDIVFRRVDSDLILDFKIANNLSEQSPAEGFIHIIAMDENKECPSEWNYAHIKLLNGFPVDYQSGQQFLIQRFKPYQRKFEISPDSELPSYIRILAYDRSGQIILEKEFPVTNGSSNDPG